MTTVVMPQLGESVMEGTVVAGSSRRAKKVERDEPLVEIATDKPTPRSPRRPPGCSSSSSRRGAWSRSADLWRDWTSRERIRHVRSEGRGHALVPTASGPAPRRPRDLLPRQRPMRTASALLRWPQRPRRARARSEQGPRLGRGRPGDEGGRHQLPGEGRHQLAAVRDAAASSTFPGQKAPTAPPPPYSQPPIAPVYSQPPPPELRAGLPGPGPIHMTLRAYKPPRYTPKEADPGGSLRSTGGGSSPSTCVYSKATSPHVPCTAEVDMNQPRQAARGMEAGQGDRRKGAQLPGGPLPCHRPGPGEFPRLNAVVQDESLILRKEVNLGHRGGDGKRGCWRP